MLYMINNSAKWIKGFEGATIFLPKGTKFVINTILLSTRSRRNLLNFKEMNLLHFQNEFRVIYVGLIGPSSGPFRYFIMLIDASRWSHVCLLSTSNLVLVRLLTQIIKLQAQFHDFLIKKIHLDNDDEYSSHAFDDYCMSIRIIVEHLVTHVHYTKWSSQSIIKCIQLIFRPLLMRSKLSLSG